jgi:hypothetical protein
MEFTDLMAMFRAMKNEPSLRAAILTFQMDMMFYKAGYRNTPDTLKEVINLGGYSLCVQKNNFFSALSHKVMNQLISGGIPQHLTDYFMKYDMRPLLQPIKEPKKFDIEDLMFGFIIWLVACGISITVFIIELIIFYGRNLIGIACIINSIRSKVY